MVLNWQLKTHQGFFLRAEDFFGFIKHLAVLKQELQADKQEFSRKYTGYGRLLATGSIANQIQSLESRYGDLNSLSHGEGFLKLFMSRLAPSGLYLLDEPEIALSPKHQLSLISLIKNMVTQSCQFIIATHSPILMAFPEATIYSFDTIPPTIVSYQNLPHVILTKDFLSNPQAFLRHL